MAYRPIPLLQTGVYPLTNVQPFVHRDGATYAELLYLALKKINSIIGDVNDSNTELYDLIISELNATITAVNDALEAQEIDTAQAIQQLETYVNSAVDSVINNSITLQDPVAAALMEDDESLLHAATTQVISGSFAGLSLATAKGMFLDIWPSTPIPSTYDDFIASIDAELEGVSPKLNLGTDSYGNPVHAYVYGSGATVLLASGIHGWETTGQAAAKQFFVQFVTSDHPLMQVLRQKVRIVFVPTVVPGAYGSTRENSNGVDVNRNFPLNWQWETSEVKGVSALDQPESQILKQVFDSHEPGLFIDCHNYGSGDGAGVMGYGQATNYILNKPSLFGRIHSNWLNANPGHPTIGLQANPRSATAVNWAQKYMRFDLGLRSAYSTVLECRNSISGSTQSNLTRNGARFYCSYILQIVLEWLETGQGDEPFYDKWWTGNRVSTVGFDTPVSSGGRRLTDEWASVEFINTTTLSNSSFVEIPLRAPGVFTVFGSANMQCVGAEVEIDVGVSVGLRGAAATAPIASTVRSVKIVGNNAVASISSQFVDNAPYAVDNNNVYAMRLWVKKRGAGEAVIAGTGGARVDGTLSPQFEPYL